MDEVRTELDAAIALVDSPVARIRLGGLLRLVRLADDVPRLRQGVVTVLGAYLRRPVPAGKDRESRSERDTRRAVLAALREHLTDPDAATTWCGLAVDLRGCVLSGDLSGVRVTAGGAVRLDSAFVPAGTTLDLSGVRVAGGLLSLDRLDVAGRVDASGLVVEAGGDASFDRLAVASGAEVVLDDARVSDGCLSLREGRLDGGLSLLRLQASGGAVSLHEAHVAGSLRLDDAVVDGGRLHVSAVTVEAGGLHLRGARVERGLLSLTFTTVHRGRLDLAGVLVGDEGDVRLEGLHADDAADVTWGPFEPPAAGDAPGTDEATGVVRDLDLRGPEPADRWAWLREEEMTTPDAPGRQDVPSPQERAAS